MRIRLPGIGLPQKRKLCAARRHISPTCWNSLWGRDKYLCPGLLQSVLQISLAIMARGQYDMPQARSNIVLGPSRPRISPPLSTSSRSPASSPASTASTSPKGSPTTASSPSSLSPSALAASGQHVNGMKAQLGTTTSLDQTR